MALASKHDIRGLVVCFSEARLPVCIGRGFVSFSVVFGEDVVRAGAVFLATETKLNTADFLLDLQCERVIWDKFFPSPQHLL